MITCLFSPLLKSSNILLTVLVFVTLANHSCLAANLWIGIYNGEMVFNRLLGIGWSDLDDFFGRAPWNFNSGEMVKKSAL